MPITIADLHRQLKLTTTSISLITDHPHPWVIYPIKSEEKWTLQQALQEGFRTKAAQWTWSKADVDKLKEILRTIHSKEEFVHTKDPYHWISHHQFDGRIPKGCVKKKVLEIANHHAPVE